MPGTFSMDIACLQTSPFKAVILLSFWAIPPKKNNNNNNKLNSANIHWWNIFLIEVLTGRFTSIFLAPSPRAIIPDARPPRYIKRATSRRSHEKIGDREQSTR